MSLRDKAYDVFILFSVVLLAALIGSALTGCATPKTQGVVVMAHGGDAEWNANVEAAVAPVAKRWPVEIAYGMAVTSAIEAAVARLEAKGVTEVAVVRMFVSGESWLEETEYILGLRPALDPAKLEAHGNMHHHGSGGHQMEAPRPIAKKAELKLSRAGVGDSALVEGILADRIQALSTTPATETVIVLAHGPGDDAENERWLAAMDRRLEPIRKSAGLRKVEVACLREDWPEKRAEAETKLRALVEDGNKDGGRVIVVPFRISGFGPYKKVLDGLSYVADERGFLPHANMTRWIEDTAASLLGP